MKKFKKEPQETVLYKGPITYYQGETTFVKLLTGKSKATKCVGILTTGRFAACTVYATFPFGPLLWLVSWLIGRKIIFEVPLQSFASIKKGQGMVFSLITVEGSEYRIASDTFFDKREAWTKAITDAVLAAASTTKTTANEAEVVFTRA